MRGRTAKKIDVMVRGEMLPRGEYNKDLEGTPCLRRRKKKYWNKLSHIERGKLSKDFR